MDEISQSREAAWLTLLTSPVTKGKLHFQKYYTDSTKTKTDIIVAYGVENCCGYPLSLEYLKVISGNSPIVLHHKTTVKPTERDVQEGEQIMWIDTSVTPIKVSVAERNIVTGLIKFTELGSKLEKFYLMKEGVYAHASLNIYREEGDFYSSYELDSKLEESILEVVKPDIDKLKAKAYNYKLSYTPPQTVFDRTASCFLRMNGTMSIDTDENVGGQWVRKDVTDESTWVAKGPNGDLIVLGKDINLNAVELKSLSSFEIKVISTYDEIFTSSVNFPVNFVNRTWYGILGNSIDIESSTTSSEIDEKLNSDFVTETKLRTNFEFTRDIDNFHKIVVLYPQEYGLIDRILDGDGIDVTSSYNYRDITVDGVDYCMYICTSIKGSNITQKFKYYGLE